MNPLHKYQKILRIQHDLSYLLYMIVEDPNADAYDLMLVKQIRTKDENDLSNYESAFISYWRNKILYNMIDDKFVDADLLRKIKNYGI